MEHFITYEHHDIFMAKIKLEEDEVKFLRDFVKNGRKSARELTRARTLLLADENKSGKTDKEISEALGIHPITSHNIRRRYHEQGFAALKEGSRSGKPSKFTKKQEAMIIATACTQAPEGYERWSVRFLADKLVELNVVEEISRNTVWRTLKKMNSNRT